MSRSPNFSMRATFSAISGSVGGISLHSSHDSSSIRYKSSFDIANLFHEDQLSRSSIFKCVPNSLLARSHQTSIDSAKTPSKSTAIFSFEGETLGNCFPTPAQKSGFNLERKDTERPWLRSEKTLKPYALESSE